MQNETLFVGKINHHFETITSTNDYASMLLNNSKPQEGTCVSADYQSLGRGQMGNVWYSSPNKNLLCSIVLYPKFLTAQNNFHLNMMSAVAVMKTIEKCGVDAAIKWPNDIYVKNKKIAGILVQNILSGTTIKSSIIGIGININEIDFPNWIPNPTSLKLELQNTLSIQEVKTNLFCALEHQYNLLFTQSYKTVETTYLENLFQKDVIATYKDRNNKLFEGKIVGINSAGKLIIHDLEGNELTFDFKEITFEGLT